MRILVAVLFLGVACEAWAECGKLCHYDWWKNATPTDLQAELNAGADVTARGDFNGPSDTLTPLHWAAQASIPENIQALVAAGADVMARDKAGKTPWDLAQTTQGLKGTNAYTALGKATCGSGYWFKNLVGLCG